MRPRLRGAIVPVFLVIAHLVLQLHSSPGWGVAEEQKARTTSKRERLIVWNVGQGQWVTWVRAQSCVHFDLGGERAPWRRVEAECHGKANIALLSHWDWDHVSFARAATRRLGQFCVARLPALPPLTAHAKDTAAQLKPCVGVQLNEIAELTPVTLQAQTQRHRPGRACRRGNLVNCSPPLPTRPPSNESSRVFLLSRWALIPGDSTKKMEKIWLRARALAGAGPRWLVLGHHGSRTSTSEALLTHLSGLKQALASSRMARFGHPHAEVRTACRKHGVALISTEAWGHVILELDR